MYVSTKYEFNIRAKAALVIITIQLCFKSPPRRLETDLIHFLSQSGFTRLLFWRALSPPCGIVGYRAKIDPYTIQLNDFEIYVSCFQGKYPSVTASLFPHLMAFFVFSQVPQLFFV